MSLNRKLHSTASLLMLVLALSSASVTPCHADDSGAWLSVQINKGWDKAYAFGRAEYRSFHQFGDTEARFLVAGGGLKMTPWLKADVSYEYWSVSPDINIHKLVLCGTGTLAREGLSVALREKLEFAYNPLTSTTSPTLRSRLRAGYAIPGIALRPYMMAEVFSWTGWVRSLNYVGAEVPIADHHVIDFFYMYHLPAGAEPVHVLGLGYVFNF